MEHQPAGKEPAKSRGRVLCVTSNFPRWQGDSTTPFVLHLARELQALGWTVDVLAPHAEHGTASSEVIDGVRVERFHYLWPRRLQTVCYHGGALVNLRSNRLNVLKLPALVFCQWVAIFKRLLSRRYDVMHSHWILPQGFNASIASMFLGIPHVLTVHGGDVFALKSRVLQRFKRFSVRKADTVTVNSSVTRAAVLAIDETPRDLRTIPMGVDTESEAPSPEETRAVRLRYAAESEPLIMFVGRVVEEKGVEDFIRAIDILRRAYPAIRGVVVGDGPDRPHFESLAQSLGLEGNVSFPGWMESDQVRAHLAVADVFVGPSKRGADGWVEAQGLTFVEAMASRTPVVATRSGGIVDSVEDGVTGLLVDEQAPEQIATAVRSLLDDAALSQRLADAAYERVISRFSRRASAEAFSTLFTQLISGSERSQGR